MATTSKLYGQYLLRLLNGTSAITNGTTKLKVALLKNTYVPDQDTHALFSQVSEHEVTGTGYTAGGKTLTSVTTAYSSVAKTATVDAADVVWTTSTLTARYAVVYINDVSLGHPLVGYIDFGQDISSYIGDFSIVFNSLGIATIGMS